MAEYYGEMWGKGKTAAKKSGTASTGITAHIRSWDYGVYVELSEDNGTKMVRIWRTGGSHDETKRELLLEEVA